MDYKKLRDTRNSSNPFAQRLGIFVEEIGANASGHRCDVAKEADVAATVALENPPTNPVPAC